MELLRSLPPPQPFFPLLARCRCCCQSQKISASPDLRTKHDAWRRGGGGRGVGREKKNNLTRDIPTKACKVWAFSGMSSSSRIGHGRSTDSGSRHPALFDKSTKYSQYHERVHPGKVARSDGAEEIGPQVPAEEEEGGRQAKRQRRGRQGACEVGRAAEQRRVAERTLPTRQAPSSQRSSAPSASRRPGPVPPFQPSRCCKVAS